MYGHLTADNDALLAKVFLMYEESYAYACIHSHNGIYGAHGHKG